MPSGYNTVSTFNPQQQQLFGQHAQGLSSLQPQIMKYLQGLFSDDSESAAAFEAPYMRQFNEQTIPALAERFAGLGATSSSGFQQALGQAGAGLSENLASLREQLKYGAAQQGMGGIENLLNMNTQAMLPKMMKQPGFLKQLMMALAGGAGQGAGAFANPTSWM